MTKEEEKFISSLRLQRGITKRQVAQLIFETWTDPEIRRYTSDRTNRFHNFESFNEWYKGGKTIYVLEDEFNNLFGIIWFGKRQLPKRDYLCELDVEKFETTFAIRLYSIARGKGVAKEFMSEALDDFSKLNSNGIWLETGIENKPALALYKAAGWTQITTPNDERRILMVFGKLF